MRKWAKMLAHHIEIARIYAIKIVLWYALQWNIAKYKWDWGSPKADPWTTKKITIRKNWWETLQALSSHRIPFHVVINDHVMNTNLIPWPMS